MGDALEPPDRFVPALMKHLTESRDWFVTKIDDTSMREAVDAVAPLPSEEQLRMLMNAVFYGSILREEGRAVVVTAELTKKEGLRAAPRPHLFFEEERLLEPALIAKLSPSLGPQLHLAVAPGEGLHCWGMIEAPVTSLADTSLRLRVTRPGHFSISFFGQTRFLYSAGLGVLTGFTGKPEPEFIEMMHLQSALPIGPLNSAVTMWTLLSLAVASVASGHGATFIVLPSAVPSKQIVRSYSVQDAFGLREAAADWNALLDIPNLKKFSREEAIAKEVSYRKAIAGVGHLASVDGAVLFSPALQVLAFGAILANEPFTGMVNPKMRPTGSRHNSAINFVGANAGVVAVVVSQDGAVTLVTNSDGAVTCTKLDEIRSTGPTFSYRGLGNAS